MNHRSISFSEALVSRIKEEIGLIQGLSDSTFKIYCNSNTSLLIGSSSAREIKKTNRTCHTCNLRTVVTPSGLYICSYHRGNKRFRYGESDPKLFREIWRSDQRQRIVNDVIIPSDCNFHCAREESNTLIDDLSTGRTVVDAVPDEDLFI